MLDDPLCFNINSFNIKKMTHQHDDKLGNGKQTYGKQAFIWKLGKMMRRYIHIYIYIYMYTYI